MNILCIVALISAYGPSRMDPDPTKPRLVGSHPVTAIFLISPVVRQELKLTSDQVKECEILRNSNAAKSRTYYNRKAEREGKRGESDEIFNDYLQSEFTDELERVLSKEQLLRFLQINFQVQGILSFFDRHTQIRLTMSQKQMGEIDTIAKQFHEQMNTRKLIDRFPDSNERMRNTKLIHSEYKARVIALLTEEQKNTLRSMEGSKFELIAK